MRAHQNQHTFTGEEKERTSQRIIVEIPEFWGGEENNNIEQPEIVEDSALFTELI